MTSDIEPTARANKVNAGTKATLIALPKLSTDRAIGSIGLSVL